MSVSNQSQRLSSKRKFGELLSALEILPLVLIEMITGYLVIIWEHKKIEHFGLGNNPWGIVADESHHSLYVAMYYAKTILRLSFPPIKVMETWGYKNQNHLSLNLPTAMDLFESALFIADGEQVQVLNLNTKIILYEWTIPSISFGIKVCENEIFLTFQSANMINVYSHPAPLVLRSYGGRQGSGPGEWYFPRGIAVDEEKNLLYICDQGNDRIQILNSKNGNFICEWGKASSIVLRHPSSIYFSGSENLIYVGDSNGVQVMNEQGEIVGRFRTLQEESEEERLNAVVAIVIVNNRLYVSDHGKCSIQVWT